VQTPANAIDALLAPIVAGSDGGLVSDAGCPAVADPGALLVRRAHACGVRVVPLVGPSSILLALMASGLDGQRFAFHGYLPTGAAQRALRLRELERQSREQRQTQLFIETPYRNAAMFEAHIEQGPILEHAGCTIGVVTGIQGAYWFDVTLEGVSCHAGPTPMELRRDPWRAAVAIIEGLYALARECAPDARCTIGDMAVTPGARNTVPQRLVFPVDLRHPDAATLARMVARFEDLVGRCAGAHGIEPAVAQVWHMPATRFDAGLVELVQSSAAALGYSHQRIVSGAGHDSLHTAQFAPTTMIFVPCTGGLSHNEAEDAKAADLAAGANVLLHAVLQAANTP